MTALSDKYKNTEKEIVDKVGKDWNHPTARLHIVGRLLSYRQLIEYLTSKERHDGR